VSVSKNTNFPVNTLLFGILGIGILHLVTRRPISDIQNIGGGEPSKFGSEKDRLKLQFMMGDEECRTFTDSQVPIDQFRQLKDHLPFVAAITKINKYYTLADNESGTTP
jgi:hypothetical protein